MTISLMTAEPPAAPEPKPNDDSWESGWDDVPPPATLLRAAIEEPAAVLAEAFDRFHDPFWHLVQFRMDRRLVSRIDADDVIQEAYVAAGQRIEHWLRSPIHSLFGWCRLTLMQTLVDLHRKHLGAEMRSVGREVATGGAMMPNTTAVSLVAGLAADQTSPSGAAMRNEDERQLRVAIGLMNDLDQEMIALRHFEGLTNKQAAEVLNLSVTAASNRYIRSLRRLESALQFARER